MQMQINDATVNTPIKQKTCANMHTCKKTKKEREREEKVK